MFYKKKKKKAWTDRAALKGPSINKRVTPAIPDLEVKQAVTHI